MGQPKEIALAGDSRHGGRLIEARRLFPGAPEPFIDLSTGINPSPVGSDPALEGAGAKVYGSTTVPGAGAGPKRRTEVPLKASHPLETYCTDAHVTLRCC
jgi:hypothetical protein